MPHLLSHGRPTQESAVPRTRVVGLLTRRLESRQSLLAPTVGAMALQFKEGSDSDGLNSMPINDLQRPGRLGISPKFPVCEAT